MMTKNAMMTRGRKRDASALVIDRPEGIADRNARLVARADDRVARLDAPPFAQHFENAARDDAVEEALTIDVGRQHALRAVAERAQKIIHLGVLRSDESLQILFQRTPERGRLP